MDAWWPSDAVLPRTIFEAGRERIAALKDLDLAVGKAKRELDDCSVRLEVALKYESGEVDPTSGYLRGEHPAHAPAREALEVEWEECKREWLRLREQRKEMRDAIRSAYVRVKIERLDLDAPNG